MSIWRKVLISKHAIDIQPGIEIGPGLRLPHPIGILIGPGMVIGSDVTIHQFVNIGSKVPHMRNAEGYSVPVRIEPTEQIAPHIGDKVVIYGGSWVLGPIHVGEGAVIGAESWLDHDLPARAVHRGRTASGRVSDQEPASN